MTANDKDKQSHLVEPIVETRRDYNKTCGEPDDPQIHVSQIDVSTGDEVLPPVNPLFDYGKLPLPLQWLLIPVVAIVAAVIFPFWAIAQQMRNRRIRIRTEGTKK
jgi:hypothetical protein